MEDNRIIECIERANYILGDLMAVTEKDEVLIVIDDQNDLTVFLCSLIFYHGAMLIRVAGGVNRVENELTI